MKKIFKVGMKVYDQFKFPDMEGVVVEMNDNECDDYFIGVSFQNKPYICYYTPEGRFYKNDIPTLSTKPYKIEFQGFEQKENIITYKEALDWVNYSNKYDLLLRDDYMYLSADIYRAFEALKKLIILREYYNEGWQPDWEDGEEKFSIQVCEGELDTFKSLELQRVFSFRTEEIRDKFLEEQKELLEIAKPLL